MSVDHHARAKRLREIIEDSYHLREWEDDHPDVDLDGEIPKVPQRFVTLAYDGSSTTLGFADSVDDAAALLADAATNDYPDAPSAVHDLDTGLQYEPTLTVTLTPMDVEVEWLDHEGVKRRYMTTAAHALRVAKDE